MSCLWVSSELRALKQVFKVPPVQVEDSEEAKKGFGLCLSGSGNKEVSGLVRNYTPPESLVSFTSSN